jgi:hypothetical protein
VLHNFSQLVISAQAAKKNKCQLQWHYLKSNTFPSWFQHKMIFLWIQTWMFLLKFNFHLIWNSNKLDVNDNNWHHQESIIYADRSCQIFQSKFVCFNYLNSLVNRHDSHNKFKNKVRMFYQIYKRKPQIIKVQWHIYVLCAQFQY